MLRSVSLVCVIQGNTLRLHGKVSRSMRENRDFPLALIRHIGYPCLSQPFNANN